jgi:hypothetical protein
MEELRAADARAARERVPSSADDLDPKYAARGGHARAWRGLETLAVYLQARRELLFERFLELWTRLERDGFRARLLYAAGERPEPITTASHDGNAARQAPAVESPAPAR